MRKLAIVAELAFTITGLLVYSGAILYLVLSGGAQESEFVDFDSSLIRIINLFLYIVTFFLLVLRWRKTVYVLSQDRFIISLIVLLPTLSILWSFAPATTIKDSFTVFGSSLFGIYLATRYTLKQQLQLLALAFSIQIVLSFIFAVVLPKYGVMGGIHQGKWRGVFHHKNALGARMVISSIIFLLLGHNVKNKRLFIWGSFALSLFLLLRSASSSALVTLIIMIFAFYLFQTFRWSYLIMIPSLVGIATIGEGLYFFLSSNAEALFSAIGKDATLTGRTDLWPLVIEMIQKQPWLGYGFGGFWQGLNGESAYIWRAAGWPATHPHNGFLAICLDLGLVGLLIFMLGFLRAYIKAMTLVRISNTAEAFWPLLYLTYIVLSNLTESTLLESNRITWVLYIAITLSLQIESLRPIQKSKKLFNKVEFIQD
ncbi:O-antigen ligase family protein [Dendronalium sp. ChiSLP03b]|uniref:O-antigen ligase family protein n=1 Tax=Dendronalium sp. ChiSLP03b TaxID=3075381 RepID=UPI002AD38BD1|nr:O-antigen ligase family protein [Dendronalium sp. ChiSLP03b]MDZ8206108.1 O-antigen ligase family protein [Dendronalium sp. ChiSLP03b]